MFKMCSTVLIIMLSASLSAQQKVKTHEGVQIGGIKQWIGAVGNDKGKPLLLFLHGGPGFSSRSYAKRFIKYLKNDFIVVQWDQRGTGITRVWNDTQDNMSLKQFHADTEEVVTYLLDRFSKKKIYLVGFSWGNHLGLQFAKSHPELLHAYVSVSGMIHNEASEMLTLSVTRKMAEEKNNTKAMTELSMVEFPFESWETILIQRKWTAHFLDPHYKVSYPKKIVEDWSKRWLSIFNQASAVNYIDLANEINCPVYIFSSKNDFIANHEITGQYYTALKAPYKEIIYFRNVSHEIPSDDPRQFADQLIRISTLQ